MSTFTITFGDQAENHVGMQKIGELASEGFSHEDLTRAQQWFDERGVECPLYDLGSVIPDISHDEAYFLVIRGGLDVLLESSYTQDFYKEQDSLEKDTKAFMYGRVVNKKSRHNLTFGEQNQEPNYQQGRGRVISFDELPLLKKVRGILPEIIGEKGRNLMAEGNYYYDISKCLIGYHGDSERKKVIGVRVGEPFPFYYQWYPKALRAFSRQRREGISNLNQLDQERTLSLIQGTYTLCQRKPQAVIGRRRLSRH